MTANQDISDEDAGCAWACLWALVLAAVVFLVLIVPIAVRLWRWAFA